MVVDHGSQSTDLLLNPSKPPIKSLLIHDLGDLEWLLRHGCTGSSAGSGPLPAFLWYDLRLRRLALDRRDIRLQVIVEIGQSLEVSRRCTACGQRVDGVLELLSVVRIARRKGRELVLEAGVISLERGNRVLELRHLYLNPLHEVDQPGQVFLLPDVDVKMAVHPEHITLLSM